MWIQRPLCPSLQASLRGLLAETVRLADRFLHWPTSSLSFSLSLSFSPEIPIFGTAGQNSRLKAKSECRSNFRAKIWAACSKWTRFFCIGTLSFSCGGRWSHSSSCASLDGRQPTLAAAGRPRVHKNPSHRRARSRASQATSQSAVTSRKDSSSDKLLAGRPAAADGQRATNSKQRKRAIRPQSTGSINPSSANTAAAFRREARFRPAYPSIRPSQRRP